jgi:hypothetical protein
MHALKHARLGCLRVRGSPAVSKPRPLNTTTPHFSLARSLHARVTPHKASRPTLPFNSGLGEFRHSHPMWRSGLHSSPTPTPATPSPIFCIPFQRHTLPPALHYDVFDRLTAAAEKKNFHHVLLITLATASEGRRGSFPYPACGRGSMAHTHTHTRKTSFRSGRPVHLTDLVLNPRASIPIRASLGT